MVKDRLPYLSDPSNDPIIERQRVMICYLIQSETGKSDAADVETESNYTAYQNMLIAAMVCYQLLKNKIVLNMAGDGTSGSSGGGSKVLKRAKADVVEAEFQIIKASDGSSFLMASDAFMADLLLEICGMARKLSYSIPWCVCDDPVIPAFVKGSDFPACDLNLWHHNPS